MFASGPSWVVHKGDPGSYPAILYGGGGGSPLQGNLTEELRIDFEQPSLLHGVVHKGVQHSEHLILLHDGSLQGPQEDLEVVLHAGADVSQPLLPPHLNFHPGDKKKTSLMKTTSPSSTTLADLKGDDFCGCFF